MIEVSHLTKRFGDFVAVDDVSFSVAAGECVGFLGPNGAGKTTTMRVVAGIFPPTTGVVRVGGHDVSRDPNAARRTLGYFPENAPFYPEMSVEGYLGFVARAKRVPSGERAPHVEKAIGACGLGEVRRRLVGKLSKGYRQRVGLAQALLGDPQVLVLDEPTSGLDPGQVTEIRELVKSLRGERTIVFSSHILSEVSLVAQRVVIVDRGRLVAEDSPAGLAERLAGALPLWVRADVDPTALCSTLAGVDGVERAEEVDDRVRLIVADESAIERVSRRVTEQGWVLLELHREALTLEDIFLRLVREPAQRIARDSERRA